MKNVFIINEARLGLCLFSHLTLKDTTATLMQTFMCDILNADLNLNSVLLF